MAFTMAKIAITGAGGSVGREAYKGLSDHDVTALTHRSHDDLESTVLDIEDCNALKKAFEGVDVVVHLAAVANAYAEWEDILHTNIDGTRNVYEAAVANDVERLVFASTNHLTAMYNIVDEVGTMVLDSAEVITPDDPPNPDTYYAVGKVAGEALGAYYASQHGLEVINFRIGWLLTKEGLRKKNDRRPERAQFARALWLSPRDCRHAFERAVEATIQENPLTVHIISENTDRHLTLTQTLQGLGYEPKDDSSDVVTEND